MEIVPQAPIASRQYLRQNRIIVSRKRSVWLYQLRALFTQGLVDVGAFGRWRGFQRA